MLPVRGAPHLVGGRRGTAYNAVQALVAALLGLRHIFASAIAAAKTLPAPETLSVNLSQLFNQ